jgi:hypothetical protein
MPNSPEVSNKDPAMQLQVAMVQLDLLPESHPSYFGKVLDGAAALSEAYKALLENDTPSYYQKHTNILAGAAYSLLKNKPGEVTEELLHCILFDD